MSKKLVMRVRSLRGVGTCPNRDWKKKSEATEGGGH